MCDAIWTSSCWYTLLNSIYMWECSNTSSCHLWTMVMVTVRVLNLILAWPSWYFWRMYHLFLTCNKRSAFRNTLMRSNNFIFYPNTSKLWTYKLWHTLDMSLTLAIKSTIWRLYSHGLDWVKETECGQYQLVSIFTETVLVK